MLPSLITEAASLRQEVTLLRTEERRMHDLRAYMSQTRVLRHDFRHHLLALRGMLDEAGIPYRVVEA